MEQDALLEVWNQNYSKFYCNAASLLRDFDEVEDVLQTAILKAWMHRDTIRVKQCCYAWLKSIVRNECLTFLRSARQHAVVLMPFDSLQTFLPDPIEIKYRCLEFSAQNLANGMPDKRRMVFLLYHKGYRTGEISELLNIPVGTVKSHMHKARSIARKNLCSLVDNAL